MSSEARYPLQAELRLGDVVRLARGEVVLVIASWLDGPPGPPIALTLRDDDPSWGNVSNYIQNGGGHATN